MNCSNCKQPLDPGASFCGNCGQPVPQLNQAIAQPMSQSAPPVPQPVVSQSPQSPAVTTQPVMPQAGPQVSPYNSVQQPQSSFSPIPQTSGTIQPQQTVSSFNPVSGIAVPAQTPRQGTNPGIVSVPTSPVNGQLPAYAQARPAGHVPGEIRAIIGLVISVLAIPGAIIPIVGFVLGIAGLVIGTLSTKVKRTLAVLSMIFGFLGIILAIVFYILAVQHNNAKGISKSVQAGTAQTVSTQCYSLKVPKTYHVTNDQSSCEFEAYDRDTPETSTVDYMVQATVNSDVTSTNFLSKAAQVAPQVADAVSSAGSKATLVNQRQGTYAGQPAYIMDLSFSSGPKGQIAFVYRDAPNGKNIFTITKITSVSSSDLSDLESNFNWL